MTALTLTRGPRDPSQAAPALEMGDRLDQPTFHARYKAMPHGFRAELIGGVVYVPSPLRVGHGRVHMRVGHWVSAYQLATPGVDALDNATHILGPDSEPQPDTSLRLVEGQSRENADGYIEGAPEFVAEVASSSEAYDLHAKRLDYERNGVREYLVLLLREQRAVWYARDDVGRFAELNADPDGVFRSRAYPGLWLDAPALLTGDMPRVLEVLGLGLASPEHAAFVARLKP
jgi:Uma2 family endonuclease